MLRPPFDKAQRHEVQEAGSDMSTEALLTKEQARLLKKKKAAKRTGERFKYVNAAVRQAMVFGDAKHVFITMCELADDDGWVWHGERSLAALTGYSQSTVNRCLDKLIAAGVVILLRKGTSKWDSSIYRVIEIDTKKVPTIYTLAKFHRLQKQRKVKQPDLGLILWESVTTLTDSMGIGRGDQLILCESKDIEFDFDPSIFSLRQGTTTRGFAAPSVHLNEKTKSPSQSQNRTQLGCATKPTLESKPKTCLDCGEVLTPRHVFTCGAANA